MTWKHVVLWLAFTGLGIVMVNKYHVGFIFSMIFGFIGSFGALRLGDWIAK